MASCSIATSLSRLSLLRLIPKPSSSYSSSIPLFPTTTRKDPSRFRLFSASMASEPKESPSNNPGLHSALMRPLKDTSCNRLCIGLRTLKSVSISILAYWECQREMTRLEVKEDLNDKKRERVERMDE
ncbi:hypothetical protein CK203_083493 [Vitis vinifera]|uniref:Uncharacterized protein n=1 Tax=Vitis vinifera TaxID=29760 RepID=A0A438C2V7_VITVI|nr:hypothetical protein CK203_083493 [Vitis vinifera]